LRAATLFESVDDNPTFSSEAIFRGYDQVLRMPLTSGGAAAAIVAQLSPGMDSPRLGTGVGYESATKYLQQSVRFEPGVMVSGESTWVGRAGSLTIELVGQTANLTRAALTRVYTRGATLESNTRDVAVMVRFLFNLAPEWESAPSEFTDFYYGWLEARQGNVHPTREVRLPHRRITLGGINEAAAFRITVDGVP
jgi:hypothetical protein